MKWFTSVLCVLAFVCAFADQANASDRFVSRSRSVVVNRGFGGGFSNRSVIVNRGFGGFGGGFNRSVIVDRGFGFPSRSVIIDRGGFGGCGVGRTVIVNPGFQSRTIFQSSFGF